MPVFLIYAYASYQCLMPLIGVIKVSRSAARETAGERIEKGRAVFLTAL